MASYEVSFEELRKYSSTVAVEADTPEEAIKIAHENFGQTPFFDYDDCYEITVDPYAVKVENFTDNISYSMPEAIANNIDSVRDTVEVHGLQEMQDGHLNSIFEKVILDRKKIDLPEITIRRI